MSALSYSPFLTSFMSFIAQIFFLQRISDLRINTCLQKILFMCFSTKFQNIIGVRIGWSTPSMVSYTHIIIGGKNILIEEKTCISKALDSCILWKNFSEVITMNKSCQSSSRASCKESLHQKQNNNYICASKKGTCVTAFEGVHQEKEEVPSHNPTLNRTYLLP